MSLVIPHVHAAMRRELGFDRDQRGAVKRI